MGYHVTITKILKVMKLEPQVCPNAVFLNQVLNQLTGPIIMKLSSLVNTFFFIIMQNFACHYHEPGYGEPNG